MPYDPKPTEYLFPQKTDQHYLPVEIKEDIDFDENYPYVDNSLGFRFKMALMRFVTCTIAFPVARLRVLLKVNGKENLKKYKNELKNGVLSVVNHVHMWDFILIMSAVKPFKPWIPVWDKNMRGPNRKLIRYNRGIPLPTGSHRATGAFAHSVDELLQNGEWLHVSAEGSMWEYYMPIRPFKKGSFTFAIRNDKPVLPMAFSYRKPKGLQKLFWHKPLLTLSIGELIYPDKSLNRVKSADKLGIEAHEAVCRLAGIEPSENLYPPVYNNTDRVDYYTTTYGIKKKYEF